MAALKRDNFEDVEAKRYGKVKEAELVHHVFPKDEFPEYALCLWNLVSLSTSTHNAMHDRDTDELTEAGRQLLVRTARKYGGEVPEKYRPPIGYSPSCPPGCPNGRKKGKPFRKDWYEY